MLFRSERDLRWLASIVLIFFMMTSCASFKKTYQENPKAVLGAGLGSAIGGGVALIARANPGVVIASMVAGGLLGGFIGKKLDDKDKRMAQEAAAQAFEQNRTGQISTWSNPDSGNSGSVTPTRTYQLSNGQYCRQYRQDIYIGNEKHQTYGTACRQSDGTWKVQE
jgi:surface antigen